MEYVINEKEFGKFKMPRPEWMSKGEFNQIKNQVHEEIEAWVCNQKYRANKLRELRTPHE